MYKVTWKSMKEETFECLCSNEEELKTTIENIMGQSSTEVSLTGKPYADQAIEMLDLGAISYTGFTVSNNVLFFKVEKL